MGSRISGAGDRRSKMGGSRRFRRGIYLLPTIFTIGNLFCGFYSLVLAFRGDLERAALMIVVAGILDGLDGRIARLTGTTTEFGNQFDSLADVVSFGVAPALLAYRWALLPLGRIGWLVTFLFLVCTAMRLARFNIQASVGDKRFFAGLPSPSAAGALACVVFAFPLPAELGWVPVSAAIMVATLGLLMVSRFRYRSFKEFDLRSRRSYLYVLPLAVIVVAIAIHPKGALLFFAALYLVSAPAAYLWTLITRKGSQGSAEPAEQAAEAVVDDSGLR
jgi:CDP-diacylglycerol--serine O-phosphatidyltransferase